MKRKRTNPVEPLPKHLERSLKKKLNELTQDDLQKFNLDLIQYLERQRDRLAQKS